MKRRNLKLVAIATLVGSFAASCTLLKDLEYTVTPNPIEQHGDTCTLRINGKFVEKGLNAKALVEVTPVLINSDGTERSFKTEFFKGEKAAGNGIVVPKAGKSFTYNSEIGCECGEFAASELKVKLLPKKGTKVMDEILTDKIADGVIHTPCMLMTDDKVVAAEANFTVIGERLSSFWNNNAISSCFLSFKKFCFE